ncbi:hypothetical protein ANN_21735 [Periplaneta americana]|uniref:Uncharacterized protein n=1 Tax=Periplaneta americana TaxID=6978 RepID=A0ABQ8S6A4_PERAM|nr:hypothetical protein ANN_21735 [Periplaneta americana]
MAGLCLSCLNRFIDRLRLLPCDIWWETTDNRSKHIMGSKAGELKVKMSTNIAAVRSVPGRSFQDQNCRHPECSEVETLGHVLGYCPKGELLRNNRHHKVRSSIATTLRKAKWEVYEEVHCLAENGSTRRVEIIAIDRRNQRSLILDPTVRFEKDDQQANNVNDEKKSIYNPCIPHFSGRYKMNINTWEVKGLLFGARGTSFKLTKTILLSLKFSNEDIN